VPPPPARCAAAGNEGRPTLWQVRTLDTGRLAPFHWPSIRFRVVPAIDSTDNIFKMATHVLRKVAVPMAFLNAFYERSDLGLVVAVQAPLALLDAYIQSQMRQDDLQLERAPRRHRGGGDDDGDRDSDEEGGSSGSDEDEGEDGAAAPPVAPELSGAVKNEIKQLLAQWREAGLSKDLYRSFSHAVFALRAEVDPPFILFFSLKDRDFAVVLCRHAELLRGPASTLPSVKGKPILAWPIRDHARHVAPPEVLCQRAHCARSAGPPPDPRVMATFEHHRGPGDKAVTDAITAELRKVWQNELEPAMAAEIDAALRQASLAPDSAGTPVAHKMTVGSFFLC